MKLRETTQIGELVDERLEMNVNDEPAGVVPAVGEVRAWV